MSHCRMLKKGGLVASQSKCDKKQMCNCCCPVWSCLTETIGDKLRDPISSYLSSLSPSPSLLLSGVPRGGWLKKPYSPFRSLELLRSSSVTAQPRLSTDLANSSDSFSTPAKPRFTSSHVLRVATVYFTVCAPPEKSLFNVIFILQTIGHWYRIAGTETITVRTS